ncbi:MAG: hypothetical protein AAGK14_02385 [Verrucomicrobiota bacterium]
MAEEPVESIQQEAPAEGLSGYRLRKAEDESVYGPIEKDTLIEWAEGAQIAPNDEVDECDDKWRPVHEFAFLEMHYSFPLPDGSEYGPTTRGTVAEFVNEGLIQPEIEVIDKRSGGRLTCQKLLSQDRDAPPPPPRAREKSKKKGKKSDGKGNPEDVKASSQKLVDALERHQKQLAARETGPMVSAPPPESEKKPEDGAKGVNLAKEQRIRQLEEDLRVLRKDHDELMQKYRRLNQQLIEERQKTAGLSAQLNNL